MIEGIPVSLFDGIGVVGLCVLIVFGFTTGRLFGRRQYDEVAHDRDEWRAAHRISEQARLEEREQNQRLIDGFGATLTGFLSGFRKATDEVRPRDGDPE